MNKQESTKQYILSELYEYLDSYLDSYSTDICCIVEKCLDERLNPNNMILDVDNFIFEMNKENNLLTVALKEFIEYYIKYKQ